MFTDIQLEALKQSPNFLYSAEVIPVRGYRNKDGIFVYSKVKPDSVINVTEDEADYFLVHTFSIVKGDGIHKTST